MKILITGGSGFLAGILSKYLSKKGHKIFLLTRDIKKIKYSNHNINEIQINWEKHNSISSFFEDIDIVLHTAGFSSSNSVRFPNESLSFSRISSELILENSINSNVKKIIFFSSIHVYSGELNGGYSENINPQNNHPYALSNIAGEQIFIEAFNTKKIETTVLRLSNIYGKPAHIDSVDWSLLFNDVLKQAIKNKAVVLNSNGEQERDFLTSQNFCYLLNFLINNKIKYSVYNLASGSCFKVIDFVKLILYRYKKMTGIKIPLTVSTKAQPNFKYTIDTSRISSHNLKLRHTHEEEIDIALKYYLGTLI